jgi:5'-3' exoribonuclease 1
MNESGELNLARFEVYLTELSKYDYDRFAKENDSIKQLHRINSSKPKKSELDKDQIPNSGFSVEILEKLMITTSINPPKESTENDSNGQMIDNFIANERQSENVSSSSSDDGIHPPIYPDADDDGPSSDSERISDNDDEKKKFLRMASNNQIARQQSAIEVEFRQHKNQYYRDKMKSESVSIEQLQLYVQQYIEALQWILKYYYQGCPSWSWFYPHHYAPYLSDLINFKHLQFTFHQGTPFKPFEQLLGMKITSYY